MNKTVRFPWPRVTECSDISKKKNRFLDSRHDDLNLQMGGGYTSAVRQEEMNLTNNKIDDSGRIGQR